MGENYKGRICLVTGSARGIGKACAVKFAEYGADAVVMLDVTKELLEKSAKEIADKYGCKTYPCVVDVSDYDACVKLFDEITEKVGVVDVLANCAGITIPKHMIDLTLPEWERCMSINLRGIWVLCQQFARKLRDSDKSKGNIVSISSQASKIGESANGVYSASRKRSPT